MKEKIKTELQVDLSIKKILSIVKQLPKKQKLLLSKELEKEAIEILSKTFSK